MLNFNDVILLAVFSCLSPIQGLEEMFRNITESTPDVRSAIDRIAARNDTKSREFAAILNYFLNLTVYEKEVRKKVARLTTTIFIEDDEAGKIYGLLDWRNAVNDALYEENLTAFNETLEGSVVQYIEHYLSKPVDLKERYHQTRLNTRRYENSDHYDANSSEGSKEENEYWDVTETRRIYGGNKTKIKFFPFMASVQIFDRFSCAGSIITSDLVITAASCLQLAWNNRFFRENPAFLSVRVGTHFFTVGGEVIPVNEVFFHPTYVPRTLVNNLALMRMERNLRFKRRNVKKIDFDRSASALPVNTPGITIVGWGAKTHANKIYNAMVNKIHMAVLDFYDLQSCREIYGKEFVTKTNFCAGFITTGEGACNLDVGDPGVSGPLLVGVASFGSPICGRKDTPTVFTKLGYYADWIENIMEQDVPRIKARTTTRRPSTRDKVIQLFEEDSDDSPIPPLREGANSSKDLGAGTAEDETSNMIEEPGIQPILDAEPRYIEFETTKHIQRSGENEEEEVSIKDVQSINNMKKEWINNQDDVDVDSMDTKTLVTKIVDSVSTSSSSSQTDESEEDDIVKMSIAPDYTKDDSQLDLFEGPLLTVKTDDEGRKVTNMGNVEPEDVGFSKKLSTLREKILESEGDDALREKLTDDHDGSDSKIEKPHVSKKKHKKSKRKKKSKQRKRKHSTTPRSDDDNISVKSSSAELIEFGTVGKPHDDVLEKEYNASQTDDIKLHGKYQAETQSEMTEELIEREIEKLLSQLDFNNEQSSITKDRKEIDNSNTRSANKDNIKDKRKKDDVWTLLYISDSEKEIKPRASPEKDEQGLNIDPEPFMQNHDPYKKSNKTTYGLIGKSEIYEIFAEVMKAVVNKTSQY